MLKNNEADVLAENVTKEHHSVLFFVIPTPRYAGIPHFFPHF